ncbi:hypothetical protein ABIE67_007511 [Streptomyces sp. V4I8]
MVRLIDHRLSAAVVEDDAAPPYREPARFEPYDSGLFAGREKRPAGCF